MGSLRASLILVIIALAAVAGSAAVTDDSAGGALSTAWEIPLLDTSAPVLVGTAEGFVVGTPSGRLRAYAADGTGPFWEADLGSRILSAPVEGADRLALALEGGSIVILRTDDGAIVSRLDPPAGASSESVPLLAAVPSGFVVSRADLSVTLIEPDSGTVKWSTELAAAASAPAAQCGSHLLVGTSRGDLVSIDPSSGSVRWSRPLAEGSITSPAACWHRRAYIGAADNRLYAVKLQRKKPDRKWSFLTGGDVAGRPIVHGDRIHLLSYDTYLYALEADNGHLAWRVRLGRRPRPDSVLHDDRLVVAPLNTELLEVFQLPGGIQSSPPSLLQEKERFVSRPVRAGEMIVIAAARYGEETSRLIALDPGGGGAPSRP